MSRQQPHRRSRIAGFTLVEALVATILMGLVISALAIITVQWLPNWNRGFARVQRSELLAVALDRIVADLAAAEFVPANGETKHPLFDGSDLSVTFVRTALGPNTPPGLEIVRLAEIPDSQGVALVRTRASFAPRESTAVPIPFSGPVVLLRTPYRVSFSYAGRDGVWNGRWQDAKELPSAVRLIVRDATSSRTLSVSTATVVHTQLPAECVDNNAGGDCGEAASGRRSTDEAHTDTGGAQKP